MSALAPARREALHALVEAERSGSYVRDYLARSPRAAKLDARDRALCLRLALSTTQTVGCLDELLDRFLAKPKKVDPRVRWALRLSACELLYLATPREVAVSQGVELVKSCARSASGLANAVLRRVAASVDGYLHAADIPDADDRFVVALARRSGMPCWLMKALIEAYGGSIAGELADFALDAAGACVQLHPRAEHRFESAGSSNDLPGCLLSADIGLLTREGAFSDGDAVASDLHAQLVATAATRPGSCLEIGSGRGTKTFVMGVQALRAGFERDHVALDLYEGKCRANLERLAAANIADVQAVSGDACDLETALADLDRAAAGGKRLFRTVFVDAPCSGTGTMRRHPEIPWRLRPDDALHGLPELQLKMLREASERVEPTGELIYATCSVLPQENDQVIQAFLQSDDGADFALEPVSAASIFSMPSFAKAASIVACHETADGAMQTLPLGVGLDGHFCARMVRRS